MKVYALRGNQIHNDTNQSVAEKASIKMFANRIINRILIKLSSRTFSILNIHLAT